jgi:hypothetical protein
MLGNAKSGALARALPWLFGLAACGHAEGASKPDPRPAPTNRAEPRPAQRAQPTEVIEDYMTDHFVIVTFGRDAVIDGDLEALREPLRAFAGHRYETVATGAWMPWIAEVQHAALLTSEAATLEAAASGIATMARACGGCHEATGGGPSFEAGVRETTTPPSDTLDARMARHQWAADRMWEGLTGPSDGAWEDGASALAHTPDGAPVTDPPLPPRFVAAMGVTRALADDALDAMTLQQRADVYGRFLATCAGCHAYGVELDL